MASDADAHGRPRDVESLSERIESLKSALHETSARLESVETEHTRLEAEHEALKSAHETLSAEHLELESAHDSLEADYRSLESAHESLEEDHRSLRADHRALEAETESRRAETDRVRDVLETVQKRTTDLEAETTRLDAVIDATRKRTTVTKGKLEELQARELEKGAHLLAEHLDVDEIDVDGSTLERIRKDDGRTYYRLPDTDDPLHRGSVALAHGDLLPIQQLARMDDEMLRSTTNALPSRLAATLWKARTDPAVGDNPWKSGCKTVREYVTAGDLKHWIRRQEPGTSDSYAKKLVSRTIDALLEFSRNRLAVRRKRERKNGLEYTERRILVPADAEIPGEID